jgi:hypothetical protein
MSSAYISFIIICVRVRKASRRFDEATPGFLHTRNVCVLVLTYKTGAFRKDVRDHDFDRQSRQHYSQSNSNSNSNAVQLFPLPFLLGFLFLFL